MKPAGNGIGIPPALAGAWCALAPAVALAQQPGPHRYDFGPFMMGWTGGWYAMFLGPLFMIGMLLPALIIAVLLVRWIGGPRHWYPPPPHVQQPGRAPLDILKERFARGEIDKAEYEERRRVLGE
jgi:putative membrane protein